MPSPSNIYAEKAYSDHPLAMWALDDQLDYVSYLNDSTRDLSADWTVPDDGDDIAITLDPSNLGQ